VKAKVSRKHENVEALAFGKQTLEGESDTFLKLKQESWYTNTSLLHLNA
jgi:hypothetical protein